MKEKNIILFDLDGTLTDPQIGITNSVKYALKYYGIEENNYERLLTFIGPPLVDSFMEYYGFDSDKAFEAVLKYREYFLDKGIYENSLFDGADKLLNALRERGKKVILVTSKPESMAIEVLNYFDIYKYFDDVCGATMDEKLSEKSDVLNFAVDKNNISKKDAVMIGDRKFDITAAKQAGISSVGVLFGFGNLKELSDAGADEIVETMEELYNLLLK